MVAQQRRFLAGGKPRDLGFRVQQLKKLQNALRENEGEILGALAADLGKPVFEAYATELGFVLAEIDFALKHLTTWAKSEAVGTPLALQPAQSRISRSGVGVVLIIGAWNYPLQLVLTPLVSAIAAGCCAVLKPSEQAPHTEAALSRLLEKTFSEDYCAIFPGGAAEAGGLLRERWDHIFFTGSAAVGRVVLKAAAEHLTPVTLELGGKSPCLVDLGMDLDLVARRIVWGKFLNAGQTCVAPDYVLVPRASKTSLVMAMAGQIRAFYGADPRTSADYGRIVNARHFERLLALLDGASVVHGGRHDAGRLYLEPTLVEVSGGHRLLEEEVFGPILPLVPYETIDDALAFIAARPDPLALYLFTTNSATEARVLQDVRCGCVGVNQTLLQAANPHLPFGGVGGSGMGASHGRFGFETFSHRKAVMKSSLLVDMKLRYPPYAGRLGLLKRLLS